MSADDTRPATDAAPAAPAQPAPAAPAEAPPAPRRRRRWRRWLLIALVLLLVLRVSLIFTLPGLVDRLARSAGFHAHYESLELSLLGVDVELRHLELTPLDGGDAWLHAEYLRLDVAVLAALTGDLLVRRVELDGLDVMLERDADGLRPRGAPPAAPEPEPDDDEPAPSEDDEEPAPPSLDIPLRLDALRLQHVRLHVHDRSAAPARDHELELNVRVSDLNAPERDTRLSVSVTSPKLLDTLHVEGTAQFAPERIDAALHTELRGLRLGPWQRELAALGLQLATGRDGLGLALDTTLGARVENGELHLEAALGTLELQHAESPPVQLDEVVLRARQVPGEGFVVDLARVAGLRVTLAQRAAGLGLLGLAAAPAPASDAAARDRAAAASDAPPTRVRLTHLEIEGVSARLQRPEEQGGDLELALDSLTLDELDTQLPDGGAPARLAGSLRLPRVAESLQLTGEIALHGDRGDARVALHTPELGTDGLRAELAAADLPGDVAVERLDLETALRWSPPGLDDLEATLELGAVRFDHEGEAVSLPVALRASARELRADPASDGLPSLANYHVDLSVAGLLQRLSVDGEITPGADADALAARVRVDGLDLSGAWFALDDASPLLLLNDVKATLDTQLMQRHGADGALDLSTEGALHLTSLSPPRASFRAAITGLTGAPGAAPAQLDASLTVPSDLRELSLRGELARLDDGTALDLEVAAEGLTLSQVAALLPPGVAPVMDDGRLGLALHAEIGEHVDGGQRLDVALTQLDYREAGAAQPWLAVERVALRAPRLDPGAGVMQLDELAVEGVHGHARRDAEGALFAAGFRVAPAPPAVEASAAPTVDSPEIAPEELDEYGEIVVTAPPAAAGASSAAAPLRLLHVETLRIALAELSFDDGVHAPLVLRDVELSNPEPLHHDHDDGDDVSVLPLALRGAVEPLGVTLAVDARLQPFESEPLADVDIALAGVNGERLRAWAPELAGDVDLSELENGQLALAVHSALEGARSDPLDFGFHEGRVAELRVSNVAWRARDEGEVLAGVKEVQLRVHGAPSGSSRLHIEELLVDTPRLHARRDAAGLHALGVVIPPPADASAAAANTPPAEPVAAADAPTEAAPSDADTNAAPDAAPPTPAVAVDVDGDLETGADATSVAAASSAADAQPVAPPPAPEVAPPVEGTTLILDELRVTGIDVRFEDQAVTPPFLMPLEQLDLSVRDLALGPHAPPRRLRTSVFLVSGRVPDPDDPKRPSLLLFEDFELRAEGALNDLRLRLNLAGLELGAFEGAVADSGVKLEGGRLDLAADVRTRPDGGMEIRARAQTQDLDLSEGANGPIERFLRLPTPLEPVIFALRDENGRIDIPLELQIPADGLSLTRIATLSVQKLTGLITNALAAAPLRVLGGVGSMVGIGFGGEAAPLPPVTLEFLPSEVTLGPVDHARAQSLIDALAERPELLLQLEHQPGRDDEALASARVQPPESLVRELVAGLREEQTRLRAKRPPLLAAAQAALAAGDSSTSRAALDALAEHELQRGELHARLDALLGLIGRGRAQNLERARRAALTVLAEERLARARALLEERAPELIDRVRLRRPRRGEEPADGPGRLLLSFRRQVEL